MRASLRGRGTRWRVRTGANSRAGSQRDDPIPHVKPLPVTKENVCYAHISPNMFLLFWYQVETKKGKFDKKFHVPGFLYSLGIMPTIPDK